MADPIEPSPTPTPAAAPVAPPAGFVSQQDLHNAIEKARLEERTKLRTEIETAQAKVTTLGTEVNELKLANQKLTADLQTLQGSLKPEGGVDVGKLIEQVATRINTDWQTKFSDMEAQLATERQTRERLTVEQLKARLIQQNGGEGALIPELVQGSNEAELIASIEASKASYLRIIQRAGVKPGTIPPPSQQNGNGTGAGQVPTPQSLPVGAVGAGAQPAGGQTNSARGMSRQDYAQKREALKRAAAARYPANFVTQ